MTVIGNIEKAAANSTKSLDDMIGTYKRRLDRTLRTTENKILDLTTRISLDTKGNVKGPKWTLAQTARIQGQLEGIFDENYGKLSRQFATDINGVTKIVKKAHSAVDLPVSYSKVDMKMLKNLQEQTLVGLQAFSAQTQERISQSIQDAVVAGKPYRKLTNEIKNHITGLTDVAGRPLKQYAGVYAQDGLMNAYRTLSMEKAQAIKVKHFVWMGNVIAGTRPMCANSAGKAFTEQELQELDLSSWAGKSCSVFACCGGWNCRHMLMPISGRYFNELKGKPIEVPNWFTEHGKPLPSLDMKIISPKTYKKDLKALFTASEIEQLKISKMIKKLPSAITPEGKVIKDSIKIPFLKIGKHSDYKLTSVEFKKARDFARKNKDISRTNIDIDKLIPTEFWIERSNLKNIASDFSWKKYELGMAGNLQLPRVVKFNNKYYIHDGHHRLSAVKLLGKKKPPVQLIDMDKLVIPKPIPPVKPKVLGDIIPSSKATAEEIAKQYEKSANAITATKRTASELKADVTKRLGKRMDDLNMSEWDDYAKLWANNSERAVEGLIREWAATSGDNSAHSIAMQLAAKKEFGLEGTSLWWKKEALTAAKILFTKHEIAMRRFLREMYNDTQEHLAKQGLKTVKVARGHRGDIGITPSTLTKKMAKVDVQLQPLSSFSSDFDIAQDFANPFKKDAEFVSLLFAEVPANRILSCPVTGYGCLDEVEWVVLGSQKTKEKMFASMIRSFEKDKPFKHWRDIFGLDFTASEKEIEKAFFKQIYKLTRK